jgi:membrane protease subunit (stomatin/prohibitin family)
MPRIIDVVEFRDVSGDEIVHREPQDGPGDFRLGSQVIVRESQRAVFFYEGRAQDVLEPGRHTISPMNIPILATLIGWATGGKTPFTAEVYFINMQQFLDMKWGTPEPITFRDSALGVARLRAFGTYAFQVRNPVALVNRLVGQQNIVSTAQAQNYFRTIIVQRFTDTLGEMRLSLLDLPSHYNEISEALRSNLLDDFDALGLSLNAVFVGSISPTEETARALDERAAMGAIGDMDAYMKFKTARAIGDAATTPGGAGEGMGLGAGIGLGMGMAQAVGQALQPGQPAPAAAQTPSAPGGPLTREQIQEAIDALDYRFSKGEISEETYNRLMKKWEERLENSRE